MKLKCIAVCVLSSIIFMSFAGRIVKMPDVGILNARLFKAGFIHFAYKTQIVTELAKKELDAQGLAGKVEKALSSYKDPEQDKKINKSRLFEVLLEDSPELLKELKENGACK